MKRSNQVRYIILFLISLFFIITFIIITNDDKNQSVKQTTKIENDINKKSEKCTFYSPIKTKQLAWITLTHKSPCS